MMSSKKKSIISVRVGYIDYYTAFLIPALISARVDHISQSPKGEGWYCPRAEIRAGIKKAV